MIEERWLQLEGSKFDVEISNLGRIRSRKGEMKVSPDTSGYLKCRVTMSAGPPKDIQIHRWVLKLFDPAGEYDEYGNKNDACHIDGNQTNNKLSNLRWDSHFSNLQDKRLGKGIDLEGMEDLL